MMTSLYLGLVTLLLVALIILLAVNQRAIAEHRGVLFVTVLCFIVSSATLYRLWGGSEGLQHQQAILALDRFFVAFSQNKNQTKEQLLRDLAALENAVAYSHVAVARLGEVYNQLGLHEKAVACYQQAINRAPLNKEYPVQKIYSYSLMQQGKLSATVREQAEVILQADPQQFVLRNLLAIDDYFKGNHQQAISHWQYLIAHDKSLTDERREVLEGAIHKAKLSLPVSSQSLITVRVQVRVAKSLVAKLKPSDVVFVYVKAPQHKMPLAVQKRLVSELPLTLELTNEQQMLPGVGLQAGEKVQVFAKISHSGDPLTQEGILRGESQQIVVNYGINPANILIDQS